MKGNLTPQGFLLRASTVLLVFGMLGFILPAEWGTPSFTLDVGQSIGRTVLAAAGLIGSREEEPTRQRRLCLVLGAVLLLFGLWGFLSTRHPPATVFELAYLGVPADSLLHLALGAWGAYAGFGRTPALVTTVTTSP